MFKRLRVGAGKGVYTRGAVKTVPEAQLQAAVSRGTRSSAAMAKSMAERKKIQVRNVSSLLT